MVGFATLNHVVGSSALIPLPGNADHLGHQKNIKNKTKKGHRHSRRAGIFWGEE